MEINLKNKKRHCLILIRRNNAIRFVDDYGLMIFEAKRKAADEERQPEPTKAKIKRRKAPFELHKKFINEIKNDEKI